MPVTGNTERTAPENRVFFPALDGLRAIAFLMVLFQHYMFLPWGWTGVNVFFVLSGFLITGILWDTRDAPHRARNFYVRRTLRIFPLYYGIFLAFFLTTPYFHWRWNILWLAWPLYLGNFLRFISPTFTQTNSAVELSADAHLQSVRLPKSEIYFGHFWSLCVEEQFYLVWPWIVFRIRSRKALLWVCGVVVALCPLLRIAANHFAPAWMVNAEIVYRVTPFQLDSLLLGGLVALLYRGAHRDTLLRVGRWVAALGVVVALLYLLKTVDFTHGFQAYNYPAWKQTWGLSFVNVLTAGIILCCLKPQSLIARALSLRPLRWLGRISYGAYVFHDIFHFVYAHTVAHSRNVLVRFDPELSTALLALAGTLLVAWLSFRFFETPFLNLKERWTLRA